jgi:LTXXQ motif family protein
MARPQPAPRIAAPPPRSAPRSAPSAATRIERQQAIQQDRRNAQPRSTPSAVAGGATQQRLQQLESQRRLSGNERRELRQLQRDERQNTLRLSGSEPRSAATGSPQRLQQLEGKRYLTRSERRELLQLRRDERQNAQQNLTADQQKAAATSNQQRIQALQSKGRLTPSERRELQQFRRDERQNAQQNLTADQLKAASANNQQRIQALQSKGRLTPAERRELRQLQRDERQNARLQQQQQQQQQLKQQQQATQDAAAQNRRSQRRQAVSAQQVSQGRFASNLSANYQGRRAARRAARLAALTAWQLGVLAPYVPWRGPVYWPYAYADVFYYTFWPDAYDPGYWAYAYDDFFDGVFFPDGAPYVEYVAEGPYDTSYARTSTTGSRNDGYGGVPPPRSSGGAAAPGRVNQATRDFCADQATGVTAWPISKIADAVQPTSEQKGLLDNLRKASQEAAAQFRDACPESVPMTPPGRLQAMTQRLQATSDAVSIVKPALEAFYNSLSDEQKARFNEVGPQLARPQQRPQQTADANQNAQANCSSEKAGLSNIAIDRIEELVQPTQAQEASLDRLDEAMQKAVDTLREACPNTVPMTPVGRLEAMKQRLDAMIQAANTVRPALEDFYAALNDEQKAKFNRLGRQSAQSGG